MPTPIVFISYSRKDDALRQRIRAHLEGASREIGFALRDDSDLAPGQDWQEGLKTTRSTAFAALLLVSNNYLNSPTVRAELAHLLELSAEAHLRLIPILLSPCAWVAEDWLRAIQFHHRAIPMSVMSRGELASALDDLGRQLTGLAKAIVGDGPRSDGEARKRLVILVHGIRTRAEWHGRLKHLFLADGRTIVEPAGYEYFDVVRFLCPFWTRRRPVATVLGKVRDALHIHRGRYDELVFVAHSFGSYITGEILRHNVDIVPDRVLLCGCILSADYEWERLPNRPKLVLNEVGSRDIWPILAKSVTWGFGSTGTFGFQRPGVHDRFHAVAHSDYFKPGFAEKFWVPWIQHGVCEPTAFELGARATTPFYKNLFEVVPIKWLLLVTCALSALLWVPSLVRGWVPTTLNAVVDPERELLDAEIDARLRRAEDRLAYNDKLVYVNELDVNENVRQSRLYAPQHFHALLGDLDHGEGSSGHAQRDFRSVLIDWIRVHRVGDRAVLERLKDLEVAVAGATRQAATGEVLDDSAIQSLRQRTRAAIGAIREIVNNEG